jgi:3D (Asp-Asp-Asp) domain-containing protein
MKLLLISLLTVFPLILGRLGDFSPTIPLYILPITTSIKVTMTTYSVSVSQTDSNPYETASGFNLDKINPKKHRIIAISRDLRDTFKFGDSVYVKAGKYSGRYVVHDVMNKRFKKKIDILINPKDKGDKIENVIITKL